MLAKLIGYGLNINGKFEKINVTIKGIVSWWLDYFWHRIRWWFSCRWEIASDGFVGFWGGLVWL